MNADRLFCSEPSSVIETPKTDRGSSIGELMDVISVCQLIIVEEGIPFHLVRRFDQRRISVRLELSGEMEFESDGVGEAIDSK